jgi:predicted MFS family arabinose efflux permease
MGILIEPIKNEFGASDTMMGFLSGIAFALFYATLGLPIAIWADRGNRRNIIALAITVWSAMTALCGLAQSFTQLALYRIGVGVGEAGSSPPSHSMIADLYPPEERSTALGIYALGVYIGVLIGFLIGGFVAQYFGWRYAFLIVGLPGLLIALIVRFTLVEPTRGHSEQLAAPIEPGGIKKGFQHLRASPATLHLTLGCTLTSFVGYGGVIWITSYFVRSHGLTLAESGTVLALMAGVLGGCGALLGGRLADRFAKKDMRWNAWVVAYAKIAALPFIFVFYLADDFMIVALAYAPISVLGAFYLGPTFAMVQTLAPLHLRAMMAAILLFILNLIGLGAGPQFVGILSDLLADSFGKDSIRYALLIVSMMTLWAAFHYYIAGKHYKKEIANVR